MNTLKNTVSMMEILPKVYNPFHPLSEEDILRDLEISRNQIAQGKCKEMGEAIEGIRKKYGL